jgi:tetratricopeptide (TPR) repeat protein
MIQHLTRFRNLGALVVFLGVVWPAWADDWPIPRAPGREPEPYRFDRKQLTKVPRPFLEDAAACILYSGVSHVIEPDGTVESVTHEITRLNGRKGIENLGEYRHITYDPTCQKLILNEARIIKADGTIVAIEPRHVQLRDVSTDYTVYDRDKQLVISFPNLEVGDIYEVKWTTRGKNDEIFGQFFTRNTFGDNQYPTVLDEMRIRLPKSKTLRYAAVNGKLDPVIRDQGNYRIYHWAVRNRPELPRDSDRHRREEVRLQVACSTFASWAEIGEWKHKLRSECWKCTPEISASVRKITASLKTPLEKARALTYWVRRHVRYISISSSGKGYTPRLPAQVHASRYGDCKDQAQLLAVMLKEADLDVSLVTLGMLDDGQVLPSVPSPWGTHALLLVRIDGHDHWIDTTVTRAGWDFLPRPDRDRVVYVTKDDGLRLMRTPALTASDNKIEQTTNLLIHADGSSRCRREMTFHGRAALSRRDDWIETPPGERRRLMTAELLDANNRSRLVDMKVNEAELADLDQPVRAAVEFNIERHFTGDATREGSITDSNVWSRILAYNLDRERRLPLHLGTPFESIHRYCIQLPLGYRLESTPANHELKSKWGWFRVNVQTNEKASRRLEIVFHTHLDKVLVEPADFTAFQKFQEDLSKHYRVWLTVKRSNELADAPALELLQALAPDRARADLLARIYQHNGKTDDARRVVQQALIYHPNDVNLWELAVKSAATLAEEEQTYREMVRRFPNNPKYAVALGDSLVKRGDLIGARRILIPLTGAKSGEIRGTAHFHLARCAMAGKQPAAALKHLQAAKTDHAEIASTSEALRFQAKVHEQLGDGAKAIEAYAAVLQSEADAEDALAALIRLESAAKHTEKALDYLRRYTILAGNDLDRLLKAADLHFRMGRLEDAFELAQRARDIRFHPQTQRLLGLIHLKRNEFEQGVFHLERADVDSEVVEGLIRGYLALGKLGEARRIAEKIAGLEPVPLSLRQTEVVLLRVRLRKAMLAKDIHVKPEKAKALGRALNSFVCAELAYNENQPGAVVFNLLESVFREKVDLGPAYALRGLMALQKGYLRNALADAEKALVLGPKDSLAFLVRGRVRLERLDSGALSDLEQAVALSKRKDGRILHWLAAAQHQAGRYADALANQRQAAVLRPRDPEIIRQLQDLERETKKGR